MKYYSSGSGLVNGLINRLPVELHIPGYNYCGPGTKLEKRLLRGDKPVNELDAGCMEHDIAYHNSKDLVSRHKADKELADLAMLRFKARNASVGEKIAALGVAGAMKAKVKLGMGLNNLSYRKVLHTCLKTLEKVRNEVDNALKTIEAYNSNILSRKVQPRKHVAKKNIPTRNARATKQQEQEQFNSENTDVTFEKFPILKANRKRKITNDNNDDYELLSKRFKKIDEEEGSRRFLKRKLDDSTDNDDADESQPQQKYLRTD